MIRTSPPVSPSIKILNALLEYDDFMMSIRNLVDLGCGAGEDLEWWATRTTRDDSPQPLNIRCVGVDLMDQLPMARKYPNITYQRADFETTIHPPLDKFDVLWCHNAFQYCINPIQTLNKWREISSEGAMLIIAVPQTIQIQKQQLAYHLPPGAFYHHTMVSLMYMLAVAGWDCRSGFFQQLPLDPWIRAIVYKTDTPEKNPKTTTWYDLVESKLLPESADRSIMAHGHLKQQDLIVPWVDKSLQAMNQL